MHRLQRVEKSPRSQSTMGSGQLEVLGPEDGIIVETFGIRSRQHSTEEASCLNKASVNGKLLVLEPGEAAAVEPVEISRPGSTGSRQRSAGRRSFTPTKQISLSAAKASSERNGKYPDVPRTKKPVVAMGTNTKPLESSPENISVITVTELHSDKRHPNAVKKMCAVTKKQHIEPELNDTKEHEGTLTIQSPINIPSSHSLQNVNWNSSKPGESSEGEGNDSEDEAQSEDEDNKAPIQLLGEFLQSIMEQNYTLASKLCQMILIYEPDNPEAKQFIPLIEEKLLIEAADEQNEGDEGTESSDEDSEDESSDESGSSESEDSSQEETDSFSEEEKENI
ncbi:glutamate-rich protein 2 isoform X2 [Acipenser oxyrinchus oxyrinchus]|uniref:Glutamate-rich protein 2 isoform X2 n=1 Tax=Acipenser oxyrinchus oxyrinchus TaxID=40147 RepID=A0AAD8D9D2_ACIOX|nr:glutamate-rich protein 2 isoform X2 [Acipenser oxyrinchus oxyrinchus]